MKKIVLDKSKTAYIAKYIFAFVTLAFVRSIAMYIFVNPNGFAPGGVGGLSAIINYAAANSDNETIQMLSHSLFDPGIVSLILNIPLLIMSFAMLNKFFSFSTMCIVLVYSLTMFILGIVDFPQYHVEGEDGLMIIAALAGGALSGVASGIMFRLNMSVGGTDIIGKIIHKRNPSAHVQYWILLCDCIVACFSGFLGLIGLDSSLSATQIMTNVLSPVLYSFISLFALSMVSDMIESGMLSSMVFTIITDKSHEIANELSSKLHRGVTISKTVGFYTGKEHDMLVCVTSKRQINQVKAIVTECDPNAFMYVTKAGEVTGKGFNFSLLKSRKEQMELEDSMFTGTKADYSTRNSDVTTDVQNQD